MHAAGHLADAVTARPAAGRVLREFAEHPGRYLTWDHGGRITRHVDERACVVVAPTWAVVTAVDVEEDGVAELLDDVRRLVPRGTRTEWYLGPSDRPAGLAEELKALGVREPATAADRSMRCCSIASRPVSRRRSRRARW